MALVVVRQTSDLTAKELLAIGNRLEDELKREFLQVIRTASTHFSIRDVEIAIRGDKTLTDALAKRIAKTVINRFNQVSSTTIAAAASAGAKSTKTGVSVQTATEAAEVQALRFAGQHLKDVGTETRNAVRKTIVQTIREGLSVTDAATRITNEIGLTQRQQVAVTNYRNRLDMPKGKKEHTANLYARMLKVNRANVIASTEIMFAMNAGRQEMWNQARKAGLLTRSSQKRWVTSEDERVCQVCGPMHEATTSYDRKFRVRYPYGREPNKKYSNQWILHPPAHPNCRCLVMLVT